MRGRGNNNNNRKGPNPLTRSYESNGPDVKIRGSAQQIAEKYATLARDAQSSGDRVMAENYLQHAEHYNRIIMAAQAQMPQQQVRDTHNDDEDDDGDEGFAPAAQEQGNQSQNQNQNRNNGSGPQPVIDGTPAEVALKQGSFGQNDAQQKNDAQPKDAPEAAEAQGGDGSGEAQPRRARRPRRPRAKAGDGGNEQPSGSDEPVTEAAQ